MNVVVFLRSIEEKGKKKVFLLIFFNHFSLFPAGMKFIDALFCLGRPLGPVYSASMQVRAWLYRRGVLPSSKMQVPVISVGNLTMGGSGKTPVVQMLAKYLLQEGFRPAVVSRGYGGSARQPVNIVSDGRTLLLDPHASGDEPYMLAASVPGLVVLTGVRRALPCRYACEELHCDIILLDDGFQHLAVTRTLDIVLFNSATLLGNGRVFPAGEMREPFLALARADIFLLTGLTPETSNQADSFITQLQKRFPSTPAFTAENVVSGVFGANGRLTDDALASQSFYAFSGIAHPQRFTAILHQQGLKVHGHHALRDHADYTRKTVDLLLKKAAASGASALITTHKDWVKLQHYSFNLPLCYLAIEASPSPGFLSGLHDHLQRDVRR